MGKRRRVSGSARVSHAPAAARKAAAEEVDDVESAWGARLAALSSVDLEGYEARLRRLVGRGGGGGEEGESGGAAAKLALHLVQEGRAAEARAVMSGMGCEWRLADCVLRYQTTPRGEEDREQGGVDAEAEHGRWVRAVDGALPGAMVARLAKCFGKESAFWREHRYGVDGGGADYFSYAHRLGPSGGDDGTGMGQILAWIHAEVVCALWPGAGRARYAEWWAHCRPHACGHQLHFDSDDEGRGGVRNPICSIVVYLSESPVGGPTLVTTQTLGSRGLARQGWLVHPVQNRVCVFDGHVLHGVIPGRGVGPGGRRVTLMVAFWEDLVMRDPDAQVPCASQPFPKEGGFTWPRMLEREPDGYGPRADGGEVRPVALPRVWEAVDDPSREVPADPMPPYAQCFQGF